MRVLLSSAAALIVASYANPAHAQRDYGGAQATQQRSLPKE